MKKNIVVLANCQSEPISHYLSCGETLEHYFNITFNKPVQLINKTDKDDLHRSLENADILIHQPVKEGFSINEWISSDYWKETVRSNTTIIKIPSIYFSGYNPELIYLKDYAGNNFNEGFVDYHDKTILIDFINKNLKKGEDKDLEQLKLNVDFSKFAHQSIDAMKVREKNLDIKISPYIEENFRKKRLFYSFNHPCKETLAYVCNEICKLLDIKERIDPKYLPDHLNQTIFPIYGNVHKHLELEFNQSTEYKIKNKIHSRTQIIERFRHIYSQRPGILITNMKRIGRIIA